MSRQDFVKITGTGPALTTIPGFMQKTLSATAGANKPYKLYFQRFGVDPDTIWRVMAAALARGGEYCDIFFQNTLSNSIRVEDNIVNAASTGIQLGVGIRVLKGDQTGYSFTEDLSLNSMQAAARTAANIASGNKRIPPTELKVKDLTNYYQTELSYEEVGVKDKVDLLMSLNDAIFQQDQRVIKAGIRYSDSENYILIANSLGEFVTDYQPMIRLISFCTAEQDGKRESNYFDYAARDDFHFLTPERLKRMPKECVSRTVKLFDAKPSPAGELPVVLKA